MNKLLRDALFQRVNGQTVQWSDCPDELKRAEKAKHSVKGIFHNLATQIVVHIITDY